MRASRAVIALLMVIAGASGLAALEAPPTRAVEPGEQALIDLYSRVAPAVVSLGAADRLGSGFLIDTAGHIVTNNHVVAGVRTLDVTFLDGTILTGTVVGTDPDSDLAVVQIDRVPDGVRPLTLGDSDGLRVGQQVIAIGNPFGFSGTMTTGIVSGLHRVIPAGLRPFSIPDVIQTDAVINPGNSGGPLLDSSGTVIGVTTAIQSRTGVFAGVGLAVPSGLVRKVVPVLIERGSYQWPWLGVSGTNLSPAVARANGLTSTRGAYVHQVVRGGPADKAGLRGTQQVTRQDGQEVQVGGDVIVKLDGRPIDSFDDLLLVVARYTEVGQTIQVQVVREGKTLTLPVKLEARPATVPAQ
ncbi:MAG: trypsin-like peptidase domain-containing protein [Limnochordaceae bacterium]|nr:trypsin-like peptidase domain-containing protein [Limnochordaceae bacterium]